MSNFRVLADGLEFPEGPIAMPDGSVILVEIMGQRLTRVHPDGRKETIAKIPGGPNGAALGPDGKIYVCNNGGFGWTQIQGSWIPGPVKAADDYVGGKIQRVDIQTGQVETVHDRCGEYKLNGPNDLVFDKEGGFWFTDPGKRRGRDSDTGVLYYCHPQDGCVEKVLPMERPNGVGLSPDERTVYVAETSTCRLWAFALSAAGEIAPPTEAFRNDKGIVTAGLGSYQMFDSLALEASGNVCVATLIKGAISVISPAGQVVEQIETGDRITTNICFGGPELKTAYITLSGKGQLVVMDWPRPGLPLNFLNK